MSTATKLWLGFGLLLLFLVAIGLFVTHRLGETERALQTVISVQTPAAANAFELALNVSTSDAEVLAHVTTGGQEHRNRLKTNRVRFETLLDQWRVDAPSQMTDSLSRRIRATDARVRALGDSLMDLSDDQRASAARFERRADALRVLIVGGLRSKIDLDLRNRDTQKKLAEVTRLEADLNGISAALGLYLLNRQPAMRDRITALAADFRQTAVRYGALRHADIEQRDLERIGAELPELLGIAQGTMDRADTVQSARNSFIALAGDLELMADEVVHTLARTDLMSAQRTARNSLKVSQRAVNVLLLIGLVIGIITALPVGLAIVRNETSLRHRMLELDEGHRHKDEFLDLLGHELRNPLAPLANAIPLLQARRSEVPDDVRKVHVMIERQTRSMKRIVDDLLDVSRINRGKIDLEREPLELGALVAGSIEDLRPIAHQQGQTLQVHAAGEPWVHADPARLAQMIANLVNNAIKYTPAGGRIDVSVGSDRGHAFVRVVDSGAGIPPEKLRQIFEPFTQLDGSRSRSHGGLGIGLTLVDRLARLHGGEVIATSEGPGHGSTFTLRLPRIEAPKSAARDGDGLPAPGPARHVLVVDDNRDSATTMADVLRLWGHEVRVAFDGGDALAQAERQRPDVVLLDIGLPGMDGYEVADRLRKETTSGGITLIAMTGYGQQEDRARAFAAGFDHHLTKPVDMKALQSLLQGSALPDVTTA